MEYFERNGAPCSPDANPAEHIIEVIQGATTKEVDWVDVWQNSDERRAALQELEALNNSGRADPHYVEDTADYATSHWFQFTMVAKRLSVQIWRSPVSLKSMVFFKYIVWLMYYRITCGTKSFFTSLQHCSADLHSGRLETGPSLSNCDSLLSSTSFSLLRAVSTRCSLSSCIIVISSRLVRRRSVYFSFRYADM